MYWVVKITAEDGALSSGHTESRRTAEYFVRAQCEATAIAQVTQWIITALGATGVKLLRYIDIAARCHPDSEDGIAPHVFREMGLERFDPSHWLHFMKCEGGSVHPDTLPRNEDGYINNCALNNGAEEKDCQMCKGNCPDRHKFLFATKEPLHE